MTNDRAASDAPGTGRDPAAPSRRAEAVPQNERVTINLTGKAVQALQRLQEQTGYNKTDCINRALIIAGEIENMSREPGAVYWRKTPTPTSCSSASSERFLRPESPVGSTPRRRGSAVVDVFGYARVARGCRGRQRFLEQGA